MNFIPFGKILVNFSNSKNRRFVIQFSDKRNARWRMTFIKPGGNTNGWMTS